MNGLITKIRKPIALALTTLLIVAIAAGCSSGNSNTSSNSENSGTSSKESSPAQNASAPAEGKKITLRFAYNWTGADPKASYFESKLKEYQAKHPEIEFKFEATPGEEHRTKIKVDTTAGNLPDIFTYWLGPVNLKPLVDANEILDMDEYLKKSKSIKKEQYTDIAWSFFELRLALSTASTGRQKGLTPLILQSMVKKLGS